MGWTDIFPVLDDEMIGEYASHVTEEEQERFEEWLGVKEVFRADRKEVVKSETASTDGREPRNANGQADFEACDISHLQQVVSCTLFWKHVHEADPDLPPPNRRLLIDAKRLGLVKRFAPWSSYIEPLMLWSPETIAAHPEVRFRIYLAEDLFFLTPELVALGWDVYLMKSSSIRYCPGGFWRFLALEDADALVTVIDTDRMGQAAHEIFRTRMMGEMGLGLWRVPGYYNADFTHQVRYRPILGGHFGALGGLPMRRILEAFLWHSEKGTLRKTAFIPGVGERPIQFAQWPNYGFDEWFQLVGMYPRLVVNGTLTFIPSDARSLLLPADLEYALWANPKSEILYV